MSGEGGRLQERMTLDTAERSLGAEGDCTVPIHAGKAKPVITRESTG